MKLPFKQIWMDCTKQRKLEPTMLIKVKNKKAETSTNLDGLLKYMAIPLVRQRLSSYFGSKVLEGRIVISFVFPFLLMIIY